MQSPYIDIHSHKSIALPHIGIRSYELQNMPINTEFEANFSIGIHPWHILKTNIKEAIRNIELFIENPNLKAIGECGLDRSIAVNMELQKSVFISQLEIADKYNKLLIVHNVRAFADFLQILKERKPSIPLLFHAFNGNNDILKKLLKFNIFFSFGKDILNERSKGYRIIEKIPISRLFLETDDSDISIEDLYRASALKLGISEERLKNQIYYNYKSLLL